VKIAIGDKVRVHYHPPEPKQSFAEGIVSRVDVPTLGGPVFVVDVAREVLFDREQPIRRRYRNYVRYERSNDYPGRIEIVPEVESSPAPETEPDLGTAPDLLPERDGEDAVRSASETAAEAPETEVEVPQAGEAQVSSGDADKFAVEVERPGARRRGGLISALFGRSPRTTS
jgi:hypothetical protein